MAASPFDAELARVSALGASLTDRSVPVVVSPESGLGVPGESVNSNLPASVAIPVSNAPATSFAIKNESIAPKNIFDLAALLTSRLYNVRTLRLNGTKLSNSTQLIPLFEAIKQNNTLAVLDLSDNPLGDDGVAILANVVKYKHNITEVYLNSCACTSEGAKALKSMLELNKNISVLELDENKIDDEGVKFVCQGILDSPLGEKSKLMKLSLKGVSIGDNGSKIVGSVLASASNLKEINLSHNRIGKMGAKYISHGLLKKHVVNPEALEVDMFEGLEVLDLSNNPLEDEGVGHIAKRIPATGAIKVLRLGHVKMRGNSMKKLCENLIDSDSVQDLDISGNAIDGSISGAIINLLSNTSSLSVLNLSKISLSKEDIKNLSDFIGQKIHCGLKELNLAETNIDDDGALYLANGLKFNMDLKVLNVTSNPFGAKGAKAFAKVFKRAKQLEKFFITGQSRITAEGENYLAEALKFNKKIEIRGVSKELDYLDDFIHHKKAFVLDNRDRMISWSEAAWEVVKRGCGQIIGTVIYNMSKDEFREFKENVLYKSRNVVGQTMFEHVIRNAVAPALDVVSIFTNKCKMHLDSPAGSGGSRAIAREGPLVDDTTYRFVAKDFAKDPMVAAMAKNNRLFLGRYLTKSGPAIHETHEVIRFQGTDTMATGTDKDRQIFVQIYENELDFAREQNAREQMKETLAAGGPFAIYDTILKEIEFHEENSVISYFNSITDLRHSINNLGVTAGFDLHETMFLAKRAAQCLGTINNLGRIHGDFKPRNFLKVANKRYGEDPLGKNNKKVLLPDKWVVFDLSKSVEHGSIVELRMDSSYIPPEVAKVTFNSNYTDKQLPIASEKMDVWSFGVVLYQLLTGVHLFHIETNTDRMFRPEERLELMNWINLDEKRQKLILHRSAESRFANKSTYERIKTAAVDLVNWCLQGDPYNRPSFSEILSHPFFVYRTNVQYTDVDLLLGWYKSIGSDIATAKHKNNRTHAHVVNSLAAGDVYSTLQYYFSQSGCTLTSDANDSKLDIDKRRELVQKAKTLIVILEKDIFFKPHILQKLLWAMDSIETSNLVLIDISASFPAVEKFSFAEFKESLHTDDGKKKLSELVGALTPIEDKIYLTQIPYEKAHGLIFDRQGAWLKHYISEEVMGYITSQESKVMPFRTRDFQAQAMVSEILKRSGFHDPSQLRSFSLFDNNKQLFKEEEETDKKKQGVVKVLVLYNSDTSSVDPDKLRNDALSLRRKLIGLETNKYKPNIKLIDDPEDVYKHFKMEAVKSQDKNGKFLTTRMLSTDTLTLVLCLVSQGFYEKFRDQILLLNGARGLVSLLPVSYNFYDVTKGDGKTELLNLGLESASVLDKLKDNRTYIPLPQSKDNLMYETDAALNEIMKEAEKMIEITKLNEKKDEDDAFVRYQKSNFNNTIY